MKARIVTPWVGDGRSAATAFRPQLLVDHPLAVGGSCRDVTAQPAGNLLPTPNLFTVEVAGVNQGWLDGVAGDATYQILWSE